jgi:hypothetical protein
MSAAWEHAGEHTASALDASNVVAVIGAEPATAARVALGIGRVQAQRRRVAIADVVGEVQPLRELAPEDASHGLVDYFFYGVSLAKIAHPVNMARNLFVLQSGAPPIDHDALLSDARWPRLARSFRDADALLLLVVPPENAAVDALVPLLDGVVLVGNALVPLGTRILSRVQVEAPSPASADAAPAAGAAEPRPTSRPPRRQRAPRRRAPLWTAVGIAALVLIGVAGWGIWQRQSGEHATAAGSVAGNVTKRAPREPQAPTDSLGGSAAGVDVAAGSTGAAAPFTIANPADSLAAAAYAVAFLETSSPSTANARIEQESGRGLPALTYAPVPSAVESGRLFVITGASRERAGADSLLRSLRARGLLRSKQGHLERLPLALLVQRGAGYDQASFIVNGYRLKGLPVYALEQPDGTMNLYAGAFDDPEAARALMTSFHAIGEQPRVVYRTGRTP